MHNCKICNEAIKLGGGLHRHLVKHSISQNQYKKEYPEDFEAYREKSSKKRKENSPLCIEFYIKQGLTEEEAIKALEDHKMHRNEMYIKSFDKNPRTYEYWLAKGYSKEEAYEKLSEQNVHDRAFYIAKYGEMEGEKKYNRVITDLKYFATKESRVNRLANTGVSLEQAIEQVTNSFRNGPKNIHYWTRRGLTEEEARLKIHDITLRDSPRRKEYWLQRGYSEEDAKKCVSKFQSRNIDHWIRKYGDEWEIKREEWIKNITGRLSSVSKESIAFFNQLLDNMRVYLNMDGVEYYIGIEHNKELMLQCSETKKIYYYDFAVPSKKVLIEYNGSTFHVNPLTDATTWSHPFKKDITASYSIEYDARKMQIARNHGYKPYVVWDTDDKNLKIKEIIDDWKEIW